MPATGYTKPKAKGESLSFEEAPNYYAEHTEVPAEALHIVTSMEGDPRRRGTNMSPSVCSERTTCIRQLAIKKFVPYLINGISEWQATEGSAWHAAFEAVTPEAEDEYYREVLLPDFFEVFVPGVEKFNPVPTWAGKVNWGNVRLFEYVKDVHESHEIEVFDGIWMNGKVDKLRHDMTRIEDFKTKAWPGWKDRASGQHRVRHYPPSKDAVIQLNLYRRMVEVMTGVNPSELVIRQMYRGSRIADQSWKKYDIEVWSNDQLEFEVRPFIEKAVGHFTALKQIEDDALAKGDNPLYAIREYINELPLDGQDKHMFNGLKCSTYCTQMPICFEWANVPRFDTKPDETRVNLEGLKT